MVKSISSSEISKNSRFSTYTIVAITVFPFFFRKIEFFPGFTYLIGSGIAIQPLHHIFLGV